jgi:hypothetical protein
MSIFQSCQSNSRIHDELKFYDDDKKHTQKPFSKDEKPDPEQLKKDKNFQLNFENLKNSLENFYSSSLETKDEQSSQS